MRIELPLCTVRSWSRRDAAEIAVHANCREVWRNLRDAFPHPYSEADARRFIRRSLAARPETNFAIEVEGQAAGAIGIRPGTDVERVSAEIGYWLGRRFWNRGVMTQTLEATRDWAMETFELTRLFALPFEWSLASCCVLEKTGFRLEGRLRRSAVKDGLVVDQLLYAYVPAEGSGAGGR